MLIPGLPPGTVTLEVTGTSSQSHTASAHAAAAGATLFTGRGQITSDNPLTLTVTPTATARTQLSATHAALPIQLRATFNPTGAEPSITATLAATLGAS